MATDSSQMEKAQRIYAYVSTYYKWPEFNATHLCECVFVWEHYSHDGARANQILDLKCVQVRVVGRFVLVEHEVDDVCGCADEYYFKQCVVETVWVVKGPKQIDVSRKVHDQVEEL
jgi:hypothetical protein